MTRLNDEVKLDFQNILELLKDLRISDAEETIKHINEYANNELELSEEF